MASGKVKHYVNNRSFYEAMVAYKATLRDAEERGVEKPRVPRYIGECIMQISTKLSFKYNFINYSFRDELIADAIEDCIAAVDNFKPERSNNPFAYFTQIAWNAMVRRIKREQKQAYIKAKNYQHNYVLNGALEADMQYQAGGSATHFKNDYSDDLIRNFEDKLEKAKKAKAGVEKFIEDDAVVDDVPDLDLEDLDESEK